MEVNERFKSSHFESVFVQVPLRKEHWTMNGKRHAEHHYPVKS